MDYRETLKAQLRQRQEVNPRYSLRAFAKKISLSPSKLSEVLSGKKRLSSERVEDIAEKLGLRSSEKELFVLSARVESSLAKEEREEFQKKIKELTAQINAKQTSQRNAWYFGAVKAIEEAGFDSNAIQDLIGITSLQLENAKRYIKRITKIYPDKKQFSFEPLSVLKKIQENFYSDIHQSIEADFLLLSSADQEELERKIKSLVKSYKLKIKNVTPENLKMVYWGSVNLNKK